VVREKVSGRIECQGSKTARNGVPFLFGGEITGAQMKNVANPAGQDDIYARAE